MFLCHNNRKDENDSQGYEQTCTIHQSLFGETQTPIITGEKMAIDKLKL